MTGKLLWDAEPPDPFADAEVELQGGSVGSGGAAGAEPQLELLSLVAPPTGLGELPAGERVEVRRHTRRRRKR